MGQVTFVATEVDLEAIEKHTSVEITYILTWIWNWWVKYAHMSTRLISAKLDPEA